MAMLPPSPPGSGSPPDFGSGFSPVSPPAPPFRGTQLRKVEEEKEARRPPDDSSSSASGASSRKKEEAKVEFDYSEGQFRFPDGRLYKCHVSTGGKLREHGRFNIDLIKRIENIFNRAMEDQIQGGQKLSKEFANKKLTSISMISTHKRSVEEVKITNEFEAEKKDDFEDSSEHNFKWGSDRKSRRTDRDRARSGQGTETDGQSSRTRQHSYPSHREGSHSRLPSRGDVQRPGLSRSRSNSAGLSSGEDGEGDESDGSVARRPASRGPRSGVSAPDAARDHSDAEDLTNGSEAEDSPAARGAALSRRRGGPAARASSHNSGAAAAAIHRPSVRRHSSSDEDGEGDGSDSSSGRLSSRRLPEHPASSKSDLAPAREAGAEVAALPPSAALRSGVSLPPSSSSLVSPREESPAGPPVARKRVAAEVAAHVDSAINDQRKLAGARENATSSSESEGDDVGRSSIDSASDRARAKKQKLNERAKIVRSNSRSQSPSSPRLSKERNESSGAEDLSPASLPGGLSITLTRVNDTPSRILNDQARNSSTPSLPGILELSDEEELGSNRHTLSSPPRLPPGQRPPTHVAGRVLRPKEDNEGSEDLSQPRALLLQSAMTNAAAQVALGRKKENQPQKTDVTSSSDSEVENAAQQSNMGVARINLKRKQARAKRRGALQKRINLPSSQSSNNPSNPISSSERQGIGPYSDSSASSLPQDLYTIMTRVDAVSHPNGRFVKTESSVRLNKIEEVSEISDEEMSRQVDIALRAAAVAVGSDFSSSDLVAPSLAAAPLPVFTPPNDRPPLTKEDLPKPSSNSSASGATPASAKRAVSQAPQAPSSGLRTQTPNSQLSSVRTSSFARHVFQPPGRTLLSPSKQSAEKDQPAVKSGSRNLKSRVSKGSPPSPDKRAKAKRVIPSPSPSPSTLSPAKSNLKRRCERIKGLIATLENPSFGNKTSPSRLRVPFLVNICNQEDFNGLHAYYDVLLKKDPKNKSLRILEETFQELSDFDQTLKEEANIKDINNLKAYFEKIKAIPKGKIEDWNR